MMRKVRDLTNNILVCFVNESSGLFKVDDMSDFVF